MNARPNGPGSPSSPVEILFVETSPYASYGGSKRVLVNLVTALDRARWRPQAIFYSSGRWVEELEAQGVPVRVVAPDFAGGLPIRAVRNEEGGWRGAGVHRTDQGEYHLALWRRLWHESRLFARYAWIDRTAGRRLDPLVPPEVRLIHYNGPMHSEYAWYHFARRRRIPFVTHEHGRWRTPPYAWRNVARGAAAVLCLTEDRLDRVRAVAGNDVRVAWLPNGVAEAAFHPRRARGEVRAEFGLSEAALLLVTAGHLQPWKGQELVVEAARLLRAAGHDFVWLLVGRELDAEYGRTIRARLAAEQLVARVRLIGERDDLPDLLGAADAAVHTSVNPEPFGLVVVEAMAAGIPVVGPAEGAVPQLVRDGIDGRFYRPRDATSLAETLDELLRDPARRAALGAAGRERARVEFSLARQVRRVTEIYEEILRRSD